MLQDFGPAAAVDLANVAYLPGAIILNYTSSTGLLQVTDAANDKLATLSFDTASLGSGSFQAGNDGSGHVLITHS